MRNWIAKNMVIDGTTILLEVVGKGGISVDISGWQQLLAAIGGSSNIEKAKLLGDMVEFPNDVHVEIEDLVILAKEQSLKIIK